MILELSFKSSRKTETTDPSNLKILTISEKSNTQIPEENRNIHI